MSDEIQIVIQNIDNRLGNIESAIGKIAVQDEKILNIQSQVNALWKKYDDALGPEGVVSKIKNHQSSCPKDRVKTLETRSWGIVISILLLVISGLIKMVMT